MPNKVTLTAKDGTTVEFYDEIKAQGGVKDVYFSCDKKYVVAFYRKDLDANDKDRLERIVSMYHPRIFDGTSVGDYWKESLVLPYRIVNWNGKIGVTVPFYSPKFFFSKKGFNLDGKEKNGKWFASAKLRKMAIPDDQKGTWLTHLHMCIKIARAVRRLHAAGLAHSDLSFNNVLVDPLTGSACIIDADELVVPGRFPAGVIGTPGFIAPEVMATKRLPVGDPNKKFPCIETDRHALAVLIYMYLLYRHPLIGRKVWDLDPEKDEELSMGEKAVFIEHPTNNINRVRASDLRPSELPFGDPSKMPYTICGPYLKELFDKAFIDGLHNPSARPTAQMWEDALVKTTDLVQPCQNPSCHAHWYVFDNTTKPKCPFCGTEYKGQLPILNFYFSPRPGKYMDEKYRLMVYDNQTLYMWHVNRFVSANEKITPENRKPAGDFHFHNNQWILINRRLNSMYEILPDGNKKQIPVGGFVALTNGKNILLSTEDGGRLVNVQLVNN